MKLVTFLLIAVASMSGARAQTASTSVSATTTTATVTAIPAGVPTELPMIVSSGVLRTYAFNQAAEVNGALGSNSTSQYGNDYRSWAGSKSQADIEAAIASLKLSIETIDTSETVIQYVSIMNKNGDSLFWGYAQAAPTLVNGKWTLPKSISDITYAMSNVPIAMGKDVSWAQLVVKDSNGNLSGYNIGVGGQNIYFPPQDAGIRNAYVRVTFTDGSTVAYGTSDGKAKQTTTLDSPGIAAKADNGFTFKNPETVSLTVKSVKGVGIVPSIEVVMTTQANVTFDVVTSEGKRPIKVWWKPMAATAYTLLTPSNLTGSWVMNNVPAGVNDFVPEWAPSDFTEAQSPVSTGGEKG